MPFSLKKTPTPKPTTSTLTPPAASKAAPKAAPTAPPGAAPDLQQIRKSSSFRAGDRAYEGGAFRVGGGSADTLGFSKFVIPPPKHMMMVIGGLDGTGKTRLALTAALSGRPVYLLSISEKMSGDWNMKKLLEKNNVFVKQFTTKEENALQSEAVAKRVYHEALRTIYGLYGVDGVVVIDNVTELYEIGRLAIYGRLEKVQQREYGAINSDMKSWTHLYAEGDHPTDSILISRISPIYVNGEATTGVDLRGHKEAMYQCDMAVVVEKRVRDEKTGAIVGQGEKFSARVLRCKNRNTLEGMEFRGDKLNFEALKREAFGEV